MSQHFAVGVWGIHDISVTVGIEYRVDSSGDAMEDVDGLSNTARQLAEDSVRLFGGNHSNLVKWVKTRMSEMFTRAFYVKTTEDGKGLVFHMSDCDAWPEGV